MTFYDKLHKKEAQTIVQASSLIIRLLDYSTVTLFARLRGLSTSRPRPNAV